MSAPLSANWSLPGRGPLPEWTDAELVAYLSALNHKRARSLPWTAARLQAYALDIAAELDRRAALYGQVREALSGVDPDAAA